MHSLKTLNDILPDGLVEPLKVVRCISGNLDEIIDLASVGSDRSLLALATNTESIRIVSGISSPVKFGPAQQHFGSDIAILEGHEDITQPAAGVRPEDAEAWALA